MSCSAVVIGPILLGLVPYDYTARLRIQVHNENVSRGTNAAPGF